MTKNSKFSMKKTYELGRLCTIIKGKSPAQKTAPGKYPLIVTAEDRLSSKTWQIDGKAICVPIVSSTGHGHASIKRLHYQEGKFALANILVALIPDEKLCDPKYLYYYLTAKKEEHLVSLMSGSANVSLDPDELHKLKIRIHKSVKQQEKIVSLIENALSIMRKHMRMSFLIDGFSKSIFLEMFGDPIENPKKFKVRKLGKYADFAMGGTPEIIPENYDGGIPWLKGSDLKKEFIYESEHKISQRGLDSSNAKWYDKGMVVVGRTGQGKTRGTVAILRNRSTTNETMIAIKPHIEDLLPDYLHQNLKLRYDELRDFGGDKDRGGITQYDLKHLDVMLPDPDDQKKLESIIKTYELLKKKQLTCEKLISYLIKSLFTIFN